MKIYIAPMAGITDYSFRKILSRFNPDLLFTEMVNARLLNEGDSTTEKELLKCDRKELEGTQIFGSDEKEIIDAFLKLEQIGFRKINLNMGCPQPKIIKSGAGAALLPNIQLIERIICKLKEKLSSRTEISIKIRTGYRDFKSPELYVGLADKYNLDFICVHGRRQEQLYGGTADWNIVSKLSYINRNIDFIGNGDLSTSESIATLTRGSKLDGIMLARGIVGNPWLISQAREILSEGTVKSIPSFNEVKETLLSHLDFLAENKGAIKASMEINKFIRPYFSSFFNTEKDNVPSYSLFHEKLGRIIIEKEFSAKRRSISLL